MGPVGRCRLCFGLLAVLFMAGCSIEESGASGEANNKECMVWPVVKPEVVKPEDDGKDLQVTHESFKLENIQYWKVAELKADVLKDFDCIFWPSPLGQAGRTTMDGMRLVEAELTKKKEEGFTHTCADCTGACVEPVQLMPLQTMANEVTVHKCNGEALKDSDGKDLTCMTPFKISMQKGGDAALCTKHTMDEARKAKDTVQSMLHKRMLHTAEHLKLMAETKLSDAEALEAAKAEFTKKHVHEEEANAHAKKRMGMDDEDFAVENMEGFQKIDKMTGALKIAKEKMQEKFGTDAGDEAEKEEFRKKVYLKERANKVACTNAADKPELKEACEKLELDSCKKRGTNSCKVRTAEDKAKDKVQKKNAKVANGGKAPPGKIQKAAAVNTVVDDGKRAPGKKVKPDGKKANKKKPLDPQATADSAAEIQVEEEVQEAGVAYGRVEARRSGPFVSAEKDGHSLDRWIVDAAATGEGD